MDDQTLLRACTLQAYQGSGPGGQHRNKTSTGVHLRLEAFNLEIRCCDDRSALINRKLALHRLRLLVALRCREEPAPLPFPFPGSNGHIQSTNSAYPLFVAYTLDRMEADCADPKPAASAWGLSASALLRLFFADKALLETVQQLRARHHKPPLRSPG